ncbi:MAG: hypothetical protein DRO39_00865 [Thermoprotei archaeon]|nr:MAG: hypothetical protein DRO39_00865 [Thermoprotei archaeon]
MAVYIGEAESLCKALGGRAYTWEHKHLKGVRCFLPSRLPIEVEVGSDNTTTMSVLNEKISFKPVRAYVELITPSFSNYDSEVFEVKPELSSHKFSAKGNFGAFDISYDEKKRSLSIVLL